MQIETRSILKPFIKNGRVNYDLLASQLDLDQVVREIRKESPEKMSRDEQLSFYLNAYNFITLEKVVKKLESNKQWKGNLSLFSKIKFFYLDRHTIGTEKMSLYKLENVIIRKKFKDPRIHFAINCASISCPSLPAFLFHADTLQEDLEHLTDTYMNSGEVQYNEEQNTLFLNPIFKWYEKDFKPSIIKFIQQYKNIPDTAFIKFTKYNWKLNVVDF